jgi:hypothetical protein
MKPLIIFICCILCVPTAAIAGASNIRRMSLNSNDNFSAVCTGSEFMDRFYITRISDGQKIGASLSLEECQQAVRGSGSEVICTGSTDQFYITKVSDKEKLGDFGDRLSLDACQQAVRASSSGVVCTGSEFMNRFYITRISDGKKLGNFGDSLSLQNCLRLSSRRD